MLELHSLTANDDVDNRASLIPSQFSLIVPFQNRITSYIKIELNRIRTNT